MNSKSINDPRTVEHIKRANVFNIGWKYFKGEHTQPFKTKPKAKDHNVLENWYGSVISQGVHFLFGNGVIPESDNTAVQDFWAADPLANWSPAQFQKMLAQNGAIAGTAYARLHKNKDEPPYLENVNPANVDMIPDGPNHGRIIEYHIIWPMGDKWYRDRISRTDKGEWETVREIKGSDKKWLLVSGPLPWEYQFPPMFHCQNLELANSMYGRADLASVNLNDVINGVSSDIHKILYYHAWPILFGKGLSKKEVESLDVGSGTMILNPSGQGDLSVIQQQTDLLQSREYRREIINALHATAGSTYVDPAQITGNMSGFAIRLLYSRLLATTQAKRGTYGGMLKAISKAVAILSGDESADIMINWPDALPQNNLEMSQVVANLTGSGVDLEQALLAAGYDAEQAAAMAESEVIAPL